MMLRQLAILLLLVGFGVAVAQPPALTPASNWRYDELVLTNGAKFQGLILSEGPDGIRFQTVSRPPGRPTVTLTSLFTTAEIAKVNRLSDADRKVLQERLSELDPRGEGERKRMESLELVVADWPGQPDGAKRYSSEYFTLICSGSEELTRRSAIRLEQIYAAFTRILPSNAPDARPTQVMLATDPDEYRALLGPLGEGNLLNPAVFDLQSNRVLCGSDLKRLGTELQAARIHHAQEIVALGRYEETVRKLYKKPELDRYLELVDRDRKRVWAADSANGKKFDQATGRLSSLLYHEAFHAYVATFVYPPRTPAEVKSGKGTGELPRWLNEGLAQMFETAVVEAGELRADWPDPRRLEQAQGWLKGKNGGPLVRLSDLLVSGKDAFLASHSDQRGVAERAYLTSWALAYYLTFERRLIGTPALHKYLIALNSGGESRAAFMELVGQELGPFEKQWHAYLARLLKDGTLAK